MKKTMAAYKAGVKTVIVPFANKGDLDEIDDSVKMGLEFVFAKKIQDVLDVALISSDKENIPLQLIANSKNNKSNAVKTTV